MEKGTLPKEKMELIDNPKLIPRKIANKSSKSPSILIESIIDDLKNIHSLAVRGRWDRSHDLLIVKITHKILEYGRENQIAILQYFTAEDGIHHLASLLAFYHTNRCRLRRSGELQRDCQLSLAGALELLMMVSVKSLKEIYAIVDSFLSSPLLISTNLGSQPTSVTFWTLLHPKLLPRLVDRVYEL